jgi:uncharacterized phiE125 gp8 family phage protein
MPHHRGSTSYRIEESTAPSETVVNLTEAKAQMVVNHDTDDTLIGFLISAATRELQVLAGRQFVDATFKMYLDEFPPGDSIRIPRSPLDSVTSVTYVDGNGVTQTFSTDDYDVDTKGKRGSIRLADGSVWPTTKFTLNAVTIEFVAGYGAATVVPDVHKQAILVVVSDLYENRGDGQDKIDAKTVRDTVERLISADNVLDVA